MDQKEDAGIEADDCRWKAQDIESFVQLRMRRIQMKFPAGGARKIRKECL
jgi:hypothetical protein